MSIKIPILLTFFATLITNSETPRDLCDLVYTDTAKPILCQPHPDNAPRYDAAVCCSERGCVPARGTSCLAANLFYCELGKVQATGEVSCYFEVPGYCDVFPCEMGFQPPPAEAAICCNQGICWPTTSGANDCELRVLGPRQILQRLGLPPAHQQAACVALVRLAQQLSRSSVATQLSLAQLDRLGQQLQPSRPRLLGPRHEREPLDLNELSNPLRLMLHEHAPSEQGVRICGSDVPPSAGDHRDQPHRRLGPEQRRV